ncbi:MAG: trypsin-like peptidase domain-containing protein [Candidatus Bathyarchaeota archaeon]|jgi:S1-C subfamily serine protease|nr:trypsin-like peptidase domain-containing protein [Candidatus Bathyarchaeota archaeon]
MEKTVGLMVDRKFIALMFLVCLILGGSFAYIYFDLKVDFKALNEKYEILDSRYETLLIQMQQLQDLIESQYQGQVINLTAVQIYNQTRYSVVLISCALPDGSKVQGSGFVYRAGGYIVTNSHVVGEVTQQGFVKAVSVSVTFFNGTTLQAQVLAYDVYSDLAVVKINEAEVNKIPQQCQPLTSGNSTLLMVGEPVYAIGNPFGLRGSMTAGIVSQLGRVLRLGDLGVPDPWGRYAIVDLIQFDAAVNPGNSGGPLLNGMGEVVGVTFAIETVENISAFIGIGYAIPSVILERVVLALIENGTYKHPYMGIGYDPEYIGGMNITYIDPEGPAHGKLMIGDIIVEVDGRPVTCPEDLVIYLERYRSPRETIYLKVMRNGVILEDLIPLELGERKA